MSVGCCFSVSLSLLSSWTDYLKDGHPVASGSLLKSLVIPEKEITSFWRIPADISELMFCGLALVLNPSLSQHSDPDCPGHISNPSTGGCVSSTLTMRAESGEGSFPKGKLGGMGVPDEGNGCQIGRYSKCPPQGICL